MKELAMDGLTGGKHLETWMSGVQTLLNKPSKLNQMCIILITIFIKRDLDTLK